jgi:RimJ/RimL family protein N-acetyltransferase
LLLGAVGVAAQEAGIRRLVGHVLEDNAPMRAVLAKAGGMSTFSEPGVVRVEVDPASAASLLETRVRREVRAAVHDIVTAASLALTNPG